MKKYVLVACAGALLVGSAALVYVKHIHTTPEAYAKSIVARCASAADRTQCYVDEVPKLLDQGVTFEHSFEVAYDIQELDQTGEYCHRIGHALGGAEVAKDPTKWKEVARRTPLGECLAGGLHGAFEEHFSKESLAPSDIPAFKQEMRGFCDVQADIPSSPVDLTMCSHGLGHLFVYATAGDVQESIDLCSSMNFKTEGGVTAEGQELSCYDGMFMQLLEPHDSEDAALIKGHEQTKDTVGAYCNAFAPLVQAACIARSAPLFYKDLNAGAPKPLDCNMLDSQRRRDSCLSTQLRLFARDTFFNLDATDDYCATYPQNKRGWCYASAGSFAFMSGYDYEQPYRFCARAAALGVGDQCYQTLANIIPNTFREDDPSRKELCEKLPSAYVQACIAQQQ